MAMNKTDLDVLKCLIKLEKRIKKYYSSFLEKDISEEDIRDLLNLIDCEQVLLEDINLNRTKFEAIKKYLIEKSGICEDTHILRGFDSHINDTNYPYYRLFAKIKEKMIATDPIGLEFIDAYFLRDLTALLYKVLVESSKNGTEEASRNLREYSLLLLIDSTPVEIETLNRSLIPEKRVHTFTQFAMDMVKMKRYEESAETPDELLWQLN